MIDSDAVTGFFVAGKAVSPFRDRHVAIVAAHYDDEILGIGGQLATMGRVSVIHLTDSAPSDRIARAHGFANRHDYREARKAELHQALARAAPSTECHCFCLDLRDGHASFHMHEARDKLTALLLRLQPEVVVSQSYEGGHPDHDTVALVTSAAIGTSGLAVQHWEMAGYHHYDGREVLGRLLPTAESGLIRRDLDPASRAAKAAALGCFASQRAVVDRFPLDWEEFRPAPSYDFQHPPHQGRLLYENRLRALSFRVWRTLAADISDRRRHKRLLHRLRQLIWRCWLPNSHF